MFLLDTNVLSELMRQTPDVVVVRWLDEQNAADLWISAITVAEIRLGIEMLPAGRRRRLLAEQVESMLSEEFAARCLPFDEAAARHYARIIPLRRSAGHPVTVEDAQIAAIAIAANLTLVTRNTKDFSDIGLALLNPWHADGFS